jgi:glycosyltransferase involved in cell wall biosynthesis
MRIAFIADGRAEHTRHWISYFTKTGDDVLLLSTFPGPEILGVQTQVLPGLFNLGHVIIKSEDAVVPTRRAKAVRFVFRTGLSQALYGLWQQVRALDALPQARLAQAALGQFRPDVVHALRIQNEGYIGGSTHYHPWILSSWGSDFVFMAKRFPVHRLLTRQVMKKPDAFTADCRRDICLAHDHGLSPNVPTRCFPGNGGIDLGFFHPGNREARARDRVIVYARGMTPFARLDTLLRAFKLASAREKGHLAKLILLIPPALVPTIERMRREFGLSDARVIVRSCVGRDELARLFQTTAVSVSVLPNDGIPISMLEAMACGALPVMSNLESIREWITHGVNGFLFDPGDPEQLAACLQEALDNWPMRQAAQDINVQLVCERADYVKVMPQVREFYEQVINR